jgi:HEAT repeat protein
MAFMRILLLLIACTPAIGDPLAEARQILTSASQSKEADRRKQAATALSLVPSADPASRLLDALVADKDYQVRIAALDSLGDLNDKSRMKLLQGALYDPIPEVSFTAARELAALKAPEGLGALEAVYFGDQKAKSGFLKKELMDSWRKLSSPRSAILFSVEKGIGFVPVPGLGSGYGAFASILSDAEFSTRAISLLAICKHRKSSCPALLELAFRDEDWSVRAAAIHLEAQSRSPKSRAAVESLMKDKKDRVQLLAAATYLRLRRPPGVAPLKVPKQ